MNALLIKMISIGLTLSQLFTQSPDQFKTSFNPETDQAQVEKLLQAGCQIVIKEFGAENIDFEAVFGMMISNMQAAKDQPTTDGSATPPIPAEEKTFTEKFLEQVDVKGLLTAYTTFCKNQTPEGGKLDLAEAIKFYNAAFQDFGSVDYRKLKGMKLKEASVILDRSGHRFSEIYSENNRRRWVSIQEIPVHVRQAFVSAEDKRFYQHQGVDMRGIVRAFANNLMNKGRPQGGSTITQQVVKNLLVGEDVTFERKMREMVASVKIEKEKVLSKDEILELYLNYVFLGRASWGVEMASRSYFGKSVKQLNVSEAAFLAGLTKGPNYYHPDRFPERVEDRRKYVLSRMKEDGFINEPTLTSANQITVKTIPFETPRTKGAFYYLDAINRDARQHAKIESLTSGSFTVYSTIHPELQKLTEAALRDGLADYEAKAGRARWKGPQGSIAKQVKDGNWLEPLQKARPKLYDVHWPLATVIKTKKGVKVGMPDGRILSLIGTPNIVRGLRNYDLVFVSLRETKKAVTATLRIPPNVQGAIVVMENKTGRVLSMAGGFSYAQSQYNRVTQAVRQPGSTLKPFVYLAALNLGFQPNTLIPDRPVHLPPIARGGRWWSPKNYDGGSRGVVTMRQAIERSLNLPTARIMTELAQTPSEGLDYIRGITAAVGIYQQPIRQYPFVLGAQPVRLLDMAVAYATIANDGLKPTPHFIDRIEQSGRKVWERPRFNLSTVPGLEDRTPFYQLRHILMGVPVRGTAEKLRDLQGYVAGKTGTSNNENDAWFIGFTNDLVIGVWVGYDRRDIRSSLGTRFTGARVALPVAETVIRGSFDILQSKTPLPDAPSEVRKKVTEVPGGGIPGNMDPNMPNEIIRLGADGQPSDTFRSILKQDEMHLAFSNPGGEEYDGPFQNLASYEDMAPPDYNQLENFARQDGYSPGDDDYTDAWQRQPRRVDPFFSQQPFFGYQ